MNWTVEWEPAFRTAAALTADPPLPCEPADPDRIVAFAIREKTAAIVARRMGHPRLRTVADAVLARQVVALHQAGEVLRRIGPEVIPLKGLHLIESHYRAGERDMGDLDLLVPRSRVEIADRALHSLGYRPSTGLHESLKAGGSYLNSLLYSGDGVFPVHLHWHVVNASLPLFMVRIRPEEIWSESREGIVAGARARRMAPHHLLLTLCEHALKHSYDALIHLADIDRAWRAGVEKVRVFDTARRWGIEPAMRLGLFLASRILGTPVHVRPSPGFLSRWILRSVREDRRWAGLGALGYMMMAKGWRDRGRFLRASLSPPPAEIRAFGKQPGWRAVARRAWAAVKTLADGI